MTGVDLDRQMRIILAQVTRENVLSSIAAMQALGFGANASLHVVMSVLTALESSEHPPSHSLRLRTSN